MERRVVRRTATVTAGGLLVVWLTLLATALFGPSPMSLEFFGVEVVGSETGGDAHVGASALIFLVAIPVISVMAGRLRR